MQAVPLKIETGGVVRFVGGNYTHTHNHDTMKVTKK